MTVMNHPAQRFAQCSSAAAQVHTVAGATSAMAAQIHHAAASATKPVSRTPMGRRLILPVAAAVTVSAAAAAVASSSVFQVSTGPRSDPMQKTNNMLMDSYGDKGSLEDLQKAIEQYEKR